MVSLSTRDRAAGRDQLTEQQPPAEQDHRDPGHRAERRMAADLEDGDGDREPHRTRANASRDRDASSSTRHQRDCTAEEREEDPVTNTSTAIPCSATFAATDVGRFRAR